MATATLTPDTFVPDKPAEVPDTFVPDTEPVKKTAKPRGLTTMQVLAQASPMGGEFSYAPQQAEAAAAGLPRTTELEGISQPLVPIPRIPQQESTAAQIGAGVVNTLAGFGEFLESPLGISTAALGTVGPLARRLIAGGYAASMGTQTPALAQRAGEVSVTGTTQEKTEAYAGGGAQIALTGLLGAHALAPRTVAAAQGRTVTTPPPQPTAVAPVETPPAAPVAPAPAPAPAPPQHPLLRAVATAEEIGERVRQAGLAPSLEVTRALTELRRQLEAARSATGAAGRRVTAAGQQPAQAAAGAMAAGAAAPGEASAAALEAARKAIADGLAKVNKSRATPADPQEIAQSLLAAAGAVRAFHATLPPPPAPAPGAQPEGGPGASEVSTSTEVHGPVRTQPVEGTGQVPVAQGSGRVQSQAAGGVRQQTPPTPPQGLATTPPAELTGGVAPHALEGELSRIAAMDGAAFRQHELSFPQGIDTQAIAGFVKPEQLPTLLSEAERADAARAALPNDAANIEVAKGYQLKAEFFRRLHDSAQRHLFNKLLGIRWQAVDQLKAAATPEERYAIVQAEQGSTNPAAKLPPDQSAKLASQLLGQEVRRALATTPTAGGPKEPWDMSLEEYAQSAPETELLKPIPGTILEGVVKLARGEETAHTLGRFSVADLRILAEIRDLPTELTTKKEIIDAALADHKLLNALEGTTRAKLNALTPDKLDALIKIVEPNPPAAKAAKVDFLFDYRKAGMGGYGKDAFIEAKHYVLIRQAIREGKQVAPEVYEEYPRLRSEARRAGIEPPPKPGTIETPEQLTALVTDALKYGRSLFQGALRKLTPEQLAEFERQFAARRPGGPGRGEPPEEPRTPGEPTTPSQPRSGPAKKPTKVQAELAAMTDEALQALHNELQTGLYGSNRTIPPAQRSAAAKRLRSVVEELKRRVSLKPTKPLTEEQLEDVRNALEDLDLSPEHIEALLDKSKTVEQVVKARIKELQDEGEFEGMDPEEKMFAKEDLTDELTEQINNALEPEEPPEGATQEDRGGSRGRRPLPDPELERIAQEFVRQGQTLTPELIKQLTDDAEQSGSIAKTANRWLIERIQALTEAREGRRGGRPPTGETTQEDRGPSGETTTQPDPGPEPGDPPAVSEQKDNALGASGGSPHGLPPGVPTGPPTYAAELLEATRRLGSLARSKATLRPGILGQFVQTLAGDKIYVGDIRNQRTMAHEIGHNLDVTLFSGRGALGHSMQSLVTRIGGPVSKLDLFNQLKAVSELMRGPLAGSVYRRRASELIADWVSLYLHDPARARSMAPDWATGFERELARNVDAQETVSQLLAGNVQPIPGQVAPGASSLTQRAVQLPGKLPGHPRIPPVAHDYNAAVAAQNIVKQSIRTLEANMQRVRVFTEKARELVPDQSQRNDVGAFVEGIGNLERQGDDIGAVKARMTPKMERLVKDYRKVQELQRQEINRYLKGTEDGEYLAFLQDYMGHFYLDSKSAIGQAMTRFLKDSPHAKARKIPTLKEAVDYDLHPITQDPVLTYELTARTNWRVATNRRAVAQLKNIVLASGDPVVVPMGQAPLGWVKTHNPLLERIYARQVAPGKLNLWKGGAAVHPDVWRAVRQLLEQPTSHLGWKIYDALNAATRSAAFAISGFHDISLRFASGGTGIMSARGLYRLNPIRGWWRLFERDPVTSELKVLQSTRKAGKGLLDMEDAVADAAQHGLRFAWTDSEAYQHAARDLLDKFTERIKKVPYLGRVGRVIKWGNDIRQEGLWRNTHDAYKIMAYHDLVAKAMQRAPATADPVAIKECVASLLNDAYGGQEWQTQFWLAPEWRRPLSRLLLAPDWTMSTIRSLPLISDTATALRTHRPLRGVAGKLPFDWAQQYAQKPLPGLYEGIGGNLDRLRFWSAELVAVTAATVGLQYVIYRMFGDPKKGDRKWIWQNEYGIGVGNIGNNRYAVDVTPLMRHTPTMPWNEREDPNTRHYMNLGKRAAEILRWIFEPTQAVQSKMSRPGMELIKQFMGSEGKFAAEWMQDHANWMEFDSFKNRLKSVAKEFIPFSFTGNQFALSVPMRKGMTPWKAVEAYVSVYEVAADPSNISRRWKTFLRGQPLAEGDLISMVNQISDAAYRNGHNAEKLRERGLSIVHGKYFDQMFKAYEAMDRAKSKAEKDRYALKFNAAYDAIVRLGGRPENIRESFKRKVQLKTEPLSLFPTPEP